MLWLLINAVRKLMMEDHFPFYLLNLPSQILPSIPSSIPCLARMYDRTHFIVSWLYWRSCLFCLNKIISNYFWKKTYGKWGWQANRIPSKNKTYLSIAYEAVWRMQKVHFFVIGVQHLQDMRWVRGSSTAQIWKVESYEDSRKLVSLWASNRHRETWFHSRAHPFNLHESRIAVVDRGVFWGALGHSPLPLLVRKVWKFTIKTRF